MLREAAEIELGRDLPGRSEVSDDMIQSQPG